MSNNIISNQVNTVPGLNSGAPGPSWADLLRTERTAGGLAVSEGIRDGEANLPSPSPSVPAPSPTDAIPQTSLTTTRLVGFYKLKSLLQPLHRFFKDKFGFIKEFCIYDDNGQRSLVYPKIKTLDRDNPYRRYQLNHKASARTYKRVRQFVEKNGLDDFMLASVIPTMPKFMSEYLSRQGKKGRDMAWRLFNGLWEEDMPEVVDQNIELACHVNLHLWRTEKPFEPHYHFHCLIPNYSLKYQRTGRFEVEEFPNHPCSNCGSTRWAKVEGGYQCAGCWPAREKVELELVKWEWHRQRGGQLVPFSDEQLEKLKRLWRDRLARFCKRHGMEFQEQKIDVFVEFVDEWVKLHHRLNYNGRHWSENFAEYGNIHPECPDPPEWLLHYENKARVKGWWSNLKNITTESDEKVKVSPYTGEPMQYRDTGEGVSVDSLIKYAGGSLGYVEFVKGRAMEGDMAEEDIEWLKGVMLYKAEYAGVDGLDLDTT